MTVALIAHDSKRELMLEFCIANCGVLSRHNLYATGAIGMMISEFTGLEITRRFSGAQGGTQQIASRVSCNEIDLLLFFRDPVSSGQNERNALSLLRLCDMHNIPVATNVATAQSLIHSLRRGDLAWREVVERVS